MEKQEINFYPQLSPILILYELRLGKKIDSLLPAVSTSISIQQMCCCRQL